jgi:hypothetical protein
VPKSIEVTLRFADIKRFRLFLWELRALSDEMRVMASPHSERLAHLVDRFVDGGQDEDR